MTTSAGTQYSGTVTAQYNTANQSLHGNFNGNAYTTYQTSDANAGARFGQALEPVINFLKEKSVLCIYNPALSWGWQQDEKVIRVMSATKNGIFA